MTPSTLRARETDTGGGLDESDEFSTSMLLAAEQADLWAIWNGFESADEMKKWGEKAENDRKTT